MKKLLPLFQAPNASEFLTSAPMSNVKETQPSNTKSFVQIGRRMMAMCLVLFLGGISNIMAQGYDVTLAQQCNNSNPGTNEILTFNSFNVPNGDATLTITSIGDVGTSFEKLDYLDENNTLIGSTGNSTGNCNNDVFTYTIPLANLQTFLSDGKIEITVRPQTSVNTNQCSSQIGSAAYCSTGRLQFPIVTGPNDAGVESIDSLEAFCPGARNIVVTVRNYGTNQINPVTVNWTFNGVTQTPVTYSQTLDTINGSGPDSVILNLGTRTFTAGITDQIVAWTSNPNNVADTSNRNDSSSVSVQPSLSGTFTIDPAGSGSTNYLNFTDAVNDLNQFGVCGPCTFNVKDGTYAEQVSIGSIVGASSMNTITFQADPSNSGPVDLALSIPSSNTYVLEIAGGSWITFNDIDFANPGFYGNVMTMTGDATNNTFTNCTFTGKSPATSTSTFYRNVFIDGGGVANNTFMNNTFVGGSYGFYFNSGSTTNLVEGLVFDNNTVEGSYYMGAYIYGTNGASIQKNTFYSQASYGFGRALYAYYGGENQVVASNMVINQNTFDWPYYGMMIYYNAGTDQTRNVVANNMIHCGIQASSGTKYGLYIYGNTFTDVVYNNVAVESSSSFARAAYIWQNGIGNRVMNNNFLNYGNGYSVYTTSAYSPTIDNNNLASNGANFAYYNSTNGDLAAYKTAGGGDNTINVDSIYTNLDSMRTCDTALFAKGAPVSGYNVDFDGDFRNPTTPNIGADEYIASAEGFTIGDTIEFCGGDSLVLGTTMNDATFLWSNSATTPTITVTSEGNYSVIVDGPCATGMTDDVEVVDVNPVASFTVDPGQFIRGFNNNSEYGSTYMWNFGDGTTSTEFNPWHEYEENGTYEVTLTVMNYCDTVTFSQTVGIYVGVNEVVFDNNISIYPNPASDFFNISIGDVEDQTVQLEIIDMKGQVYANRLMKITSGSNEQVDISSLSKGVYLVRLTSDNEVATRQIVVQ